MKGSSGTPRWLARLGDALARDYFSRYDRFWNWARNPLAVLILATIASALCGLCLHPQGFVLALGLGALLVGGVVWPWISLRGLSGALSFEKSRSMEGEPVEASFRLKNRCPWGAWGLSVHTRLHHGPDAGLSHAGGWRTTEVAWDFIPKCRGVYPDGPPRVVSGFPFGLATCSRPLEVTGSLLVWPRTFPVGPIPQVVDGLGSEGSTHRNRPGGSGDFLGVRPYRRGDSLRRVHWPQTARFGQMVVCELQSHAVPRVQVVLDAHPLGHVGTGSDGSREWAIRIAASFVEAWIGQGAEVELVVDSQTILARGGSVSGRRTCLLDALARLGRDGQVGLPEMLDEPSCRRFSSGLRVIIATDRSASKLAARPSTGVAERFVILHAAAFDPSDSTDTVGPLSFRPWAFINDSAHVARQVRRAWKEVSLER